MIQSRSRFMKYLAKVFDLCVLTTAFICAGFILSDGMTFTEFMAMRIKLGNFLLFGLLLIPMAQPVYRMWALHFEEAYDCMGRGS